MWPGVDRKRVAESSRGYVFAVDLNAVGRAGTDDDPTHFRGESLKRAATSATSGCAAFPATCRYATLNRKGRCAAPHRVMHAR